MIMIYDVTLHVKFNEFHYSYTLLKLVAQNRQIKPIIKLEAMVGTVRSILLFYLLGYKPCRYFKNLILVIMLESKIAESFWLVAIN